MKLHIQKPHLHTKIAPSRRHTNRIVICKCATTPYSVIPAVISSIVAFTSTYPLDTYKTRVQVISKDKTKITGLLQGYIPGVLLCCTTAFIYFSMFQILLQHLTSTHASLMASFMSTFAKVPGKSITKLLQNGTFSSFHKAVTYIIDKYGYIGFYRGFWAYVLDDVPETALRFYLYAFFTSIFPAEKTLIGICAGVFSSILTQPFDVLQTNLVCNISTKKIDYKKINYFSGLLVALTINSIQATVFYRVYHIFHPVICGV